MTEHLTLDKAAQDLLFDKEFFAETDYRTLVVVNIGKPGENAWFPRGPRLDQNLVVTTV